MNDAKKLSILCEHMAQSVADASDEELLGDYPSRADRDAAVERARSVARDAMERAKERRTNEG